MITRRRVDSGQDGQSGKNGPNGRSGSYDPSTTSMQSTLVHPSTALPEQVRLGQVDYLVSTAT